MLDSFIVDLLPIDLAAGVRRPGMMLPGDIRPESLSRVRPVARGALYNAVTGPHSRALAGLQGPSGMGSHPMPVALVAECSRPLVARQPAWRESSVPPGHARLSTKPEATASALVATTMGIVVVARLAARAPGVPYLRPVTTQTRARSASSARTWSRGQVRL